MQINALPQYDMSNNLTKKVYFFYTICPKCAKYYGKNYVIGVAEVV